MSLLDTKMERICYYYLGVFDRHFDKSGLNVFVTLERSNVQVRCIDVPFVNFVMPRHTPRESYDFDPIRQRRVTT